ncbi:MAG: rhodanese-like domain-containing protein [Candidatus Thermoplasmatota archaeon]|jgi:queuine tRNA-ribosyltransferase
MNDITPQKANDLHATGDAVILDVREEDEVAYARIPGSVHIPLFELQTRIRELPKDRLVVCQCASGGRSMGATATLLRHGLKAANLTGGIMAWARSGLPVARGEA